jgi:hypothetical protein
MLAQQEIERTPSSVFVVRKTPPVILLAIKIDTFFGPKEEKKFWEKKNIFGGDHKRGFGKLSQCPGKVALNQGDQIGRIRPLVELWADY